MQTEGPLTRLGRWCDQNLGLVPYIPPTLLAELSHSKGGEGTSPSDIPSDYWNANSGELKAGNDNGFYDSEPLSGEKLSEFSSESPLSNHPNTYEQDVFASSANALIHAQNLKETEPLEQDSGLSLDQLTLQLLDQARENVLSRIEKVNSMTSREVLAAGRALGDVVLRAQQNAKRAGAVLKSITDEDCENGTTEKTVTGIVASQIAIVSRFLEDLQSQVGVQVSTSNKCLDASREISRLGREVSSIAPRSRILSLNANIEAGRVGAAGSGFAVLAREMTHLSESVQETNKLVSQLAEQLLSSLPAVARSAGTLQDRADSFSDEMEIALSDAYTANDAIRAVVSDSLATTESELQSILSASHEALSHLQFQDPAAQNLLIAGADFDNLSNALKECFGSISIIPRVTNPVTLEAAEARREINAGHVAAFDDDNDTDAGEVMLF